VFLLLFVGFDCLCGCVAIYAAIIRRLFLKASMRAIAELTT
jgi:hypothetical protein